ncbi:MAG TPA: 16S rRNA (guanine(527)-N(7))-methyltransferase RsmG [Terriglobales bacterium]|nr:16S rRNA (guanine(527)-N(7))-methyltransferase RsmG [Terriglobales bacterium]
MEPTRIADLLTPFLGSNSLRAEQLEALRRYLELLTRWNARMNLTAVRDEEGIVTRHFGESLFAAAQLFPSAKSSANRMSAGNAATQPGPRVIDLGSGAGFPGVPLKIYCSSLRLTLVESNQKKATFLREVIRALQLRDADVFAGRGEELTTATTQPHFGIPPEVVTMRAVERFESALPVAGELARMPGANPKSRLALLVGKAQLPRVNELAPEFSWGSPIPVPQSKERVLVVGTSIVG